MIGRYRITPLIICIAVLTLLGGCLPALNVYYPTDKDVSGISVIDARNNLSHVLVHDSDNTPCNFYFPHEGNTAQPLENASVEWDKVVLRAQTRSVTIPLGQLSQPIVNTGKPNSIVCADNVDVANWIYVLNQNVAAIQLEMHAYDAKFQSSLSDYRKLIAARTTIPQQADMYRVQAEDAVRSKDFYQAQIDYGKAVDVAPWWPQGHFDRAMVSDAIGDYDTAIVEMKYYLDLVPNASNARAAQYKIYGWQQKVDEENAHIPADLRSGQNQAAK
jgi:tetratricopeptide (TPR) repeat protein